MFNILGKMNGYCDGISRRTALSIGAAGIGGMMLPDLLRAEAASGIRSSSKALINVYLGGGPSHQDMWDLKPGAPSEYRGEFSPIKTNVPGMEICEHFPKLATMADKFAVIRSTVGTIDDHSSFHTQAGYAKRDLQLVGGRPALGSVITKLKGQTETGAPSFVSYMGDVSPGFLGAIYRPYRPDGPGRENLRLSREMTAERLANRAELRAKLGHLRADADASGEMNAVDGFTTRAVEVVTSGRLADALDVEKESKDVRARYGKDGNSNFLLARRLVEAGVRVVTFNWGGWDTHGQNFTTLRNQLPRLDQGLSALIQDLSDRSMLDDVVIVVWGEFGRTPRINKDAGRDHWSKVMSTFIAGGGFKTGQMIGTTDRIAGEADDRPVHLREIFATLYRHFGIDAKNTTITDTAGRPQYLVDSRDPVKELV